MRYPILATIINGVRLIAQSPGSRGLLVAACCVMAPGNAQPQQLPDPNIPGRAIFAGLGIRDAGNLATVVETAVGVRFPVARRVSGGVTIS